MTEELGDLVAKAKEMIERREFDACEALLATAMFQSPHSAVPHNLMGLLLEHRRKHEDAMKHFRAATALDPAYEPSRWNLEGFAAFYRTRTEAYFISDCDFDHLPKPYVKESNVCI
jgi:Flp pilus assembly protein TadD